MVRTIISNPEQLAILLSQGVRCFGQVRPAGYESFRTAPYEVVGCDGNIVKTRHWTTRLFLFNDPAIEWFFHGEE